jgi:LPXTG-site transpeptidase (sortase) family protein
MIRKLPPAFRVVVMYAVCFGLFAGAAGLIQFTAPSATIKEKSALVATVAEKRTSAPSGVPRKMWIPRLKIDLRVQDGHYDKTTKNWTLADDAVQFAVMTEKMSDKPGNTLLYGHNTPQVFMPTSGLREGDLLEVTSDDGHIFTYLYKDDAYILPTDTSVLYKKYDKPQVTLMTCDGNSNDKYRRLMRFELMGIH